MAIDSIHHVDATVVRLLPLAPGIASHWAEAVLAETLRLGLGREALLS